MLYGNTMASNNITMNVNPDELGLSIPSEMPWNKNTLPWIIGMASVAISRGSDKFLGLPSVRDRLPEPLDLPDHIGNTGMTFAILYPFLASFNGTFDKKNGMTAQTKNEYKHRRAITIATAGTLSVAANVFAETVGYGSISTPDITDFFYGLLGGVLAYQATKRSYISPEDLSATMQTENPDLEYIRNRIRGIILARSIKPPSSWPKEVNTKMELNPSKITRQQPRKTTRQKRSSQHKH